MISYDFTINLTTLFTVAGGIASLITAWVVLRTAVTQLGKDLAVSNTANNVSFNNLNTQVGMLVASMRMTDERIEDVRAKAAHELAEFKVSAAKEYVTGAHMESLKRDIMDAIKSLSLRLDQRLSHP